MIRLAYRTSIKYDRNWKKNTYFCCVKLLWYNLYYKLPCIGYVYFCSIWNTWFPSIVIWEWVWIIADVDFKFNLFPIAKMIQFTVLYQENFIISFLSPLILRWSLSRARKFDISLQFFIFPFLFLCPFKFQSFSLSFQSSVFLSVRLNFSFLSKFQFCVKISVLRTFTINFAFNALFSCRPP